MSRGLLLLFTLFSATWVAAAPATFTEAKQELREYVYYDQNHSELGTAYCGCEWEWVGRSGGRVDLASCGYQARAQANRAARIEWEHIVPAYVLGHQRQCWQRGGRNFCRTDDPVFRAMEADIHNLTPAIGETNADRSNFRFGVIAGEPRQYGACDFEVDFKERVAEPRDAVKGMFARVYFYMYDRYDLSMSDAQENLLMAWDKSYPVTEWELERDQRIARITGHSNPFVIGERHWTHGHRNSAEGLITPIPADHAPIIGNARSKIYHLPEGCPSYSRVSPKNRVEFDSEAQAIAAGFRRAKNCR